MNGKLTVYNAIFVLTFFCCPQLRSQVDQDWAATYPGWYAAGVVTDAEGNSYVTGPTLPDAAHGFRSDIILVKYNQQGTIVWSREFDESDDGTNGTDVSNWITIDPLGNILITGSSFINSSGENFITLKYDPDGNLVWKARSTAGIEASRVETDGAGNVYVMGPSSTVASARNYVTIKYDADGNQLWTRTYNGTNSFDDTPLSLAVTADGMVAVTGTSTGGITSFDIATILYDTDGNQLWVRRYNFDDRSDAGDDVAFGPNGDVYVAGYVFDDVQGSTDGVILKYAPDGNQEWVRFHNPADRPDVFSRLRVDTQGNVVAAGNSQQASLAVEFVTAKYDPDGNPLWVGSIDLGFNSLVGNMILGADNSVYVTGESNQNIITYKYSSDGVFQWSQAYDSGVFPDRGYGIALDPSAGVIVVGQSPFVTIRYSQPIPGPTFPEGTKLLDGVTSAGQLSDLFDNDNQYLELDPSPTKNLRKQKIHLILQSTSSSGVPSNLTFRLEAKMIGGTVAGDVMQTIELFNYQTAKFELLDTRAAVLVDELVEVTPTGDPIRFVQPGTGEVTAGITWKSESFSGRPFIWSIDVDQAIWMVTQ